MNYLTFKIYGFIFAAIVLTCAMNYFALEYQCTSKWDDSFYTWNTGCMVNVKGIYTPEANVRVIKWEYTE
jgi:hypothetical protein